jgi:hypothetical protein
LWDDSWDEARADKDKSFGVGLSKNGCEAMKLCFWPGNAKGNIYVLKLCTRYSTVATIIHMYVAVNSNI